MLSTDSQPTVESSEGNKTELIYKEYLTTAYKLHLNV